MLAGDLMPTSGAIILDGRALASFRARDLALRRAVLPQQTLMQFAFVARDVVAMGRHPHLTRHGETDHDEAIVRASMTRTETLPLAERAYPSLSGGEQGRVSLARVLAQEAPILLLDEPTAALDLRHQQAVLAIARGLAAEGATVLAVLHDLNLAAAYADRVAPSGSGATGHRRHALGGPDRRNPHGGLRASDRGGAPSRARLSAGYPHAPY